MLQEDRVNGALIEVENIGKTRIKRQKAYSYGDGVISLGAPINLVCHFCIYFHLR
jgi:hypothetical protein